MTALPWWGKALGLAGAGVAVAIGVNIYINHLETAAYKRGEKAERAKWQEKQAEASAQARQQRDKAEDAAAQREAERVRVFVPIEKEVIRYVQTPAAAAERIDDAGRDLMQRAIEAANASLAAPTGEGGPAVPAAAGRASDGG